MTAADADRSGDASAGSGARCARAGWRSRQMSHAAASRAAAWSRARGAALAGAAARWRCSGRWPTRSTRCRLLHALHWLGAEPLLPRMQGRGRPLTFHRLAAPTAPLVAGPFQVQEPAPDLPPVLPGSCWRRCSRSTAQGRRLGYGAAFYDMTFAALADGGARCASATASPARRSPAVPADASDVPLQLVVTEAGCRTIT